MDHFEIVPIKTIHEVVAHTLEPLLCEMGFEFQKPLHWVRSTDAPLRQLFCLRQWKGGAVAPAWGLSLDFVPHVSGDTVKWHRTAKSALFDIGYDANDRSMEFYYTKGIEHIQQLAPKILPGAVQAAQEFWATIKLVGDLPAAFEALKAHTARGGLGFYNYFQYPIAYAFSLAVAGEKYAAQQELARASVESSKTRSKIEQFLGMASAT
jgi:hypothetical protein